MEKRIKEMAETLAKSFEENESLKELSNLVKEIGIEATKAAVAGLEPEAQELFRKSLEKAASMDKEAQAKTGAQPKQEESEDIKAMSDKDREEDKGEKMVKDSNKEVKHQGDDSELKGQVIKAEDSENEIEKGEMEYEMEASEAVKEHKEIVSDLKSKDPKKIAAQAKKQEKELDGMEVKKSEDATYIRTENGNEEVIEKGAIKESALEEDELHITEQLEKGELLGKMIEKMRKRGMNHDVCMSALQKKGYDTDMAKDKWEEMQKMDDEAKKMEKKDDKKEVKKSVQWDSPNKRLEAHARNGQNTHIEVDGYLVKAALDKAQGEVLEKSDETPKEFDSNNINDVIEKGYDRSEEDVKAAQSIIRKSRSGDFNMASFSDEELAKAHGMTVEQMNEILGKKLQAQ